MHWRIRRATKDDIPRLAPMHATAFGHRGSKLGVYLREPSPISGGIFVAANSVLLAGYLAFSRFDYMGRDCGSGARADESLRTLSVDYLYVANGHRRRGIGQRLLHEVNAFAAAAKNIAVCKAVIEERQVAAQCLFRRCGWAFVNSIKLEDSDDLYQFERDPREGAAVIRSVLWGEARTVHGFRH